jgi:hypothetical protein
MSPLYSSQPSFTAPYSLKWPYNSYICLSSEKPGNCRPVAQTCGSPGSPVPPQLIPCGGSAGMEGRSAKENDWDCPGESRCCLDPSGCHSVCRPTPNCKDVIFVFESLLLRKSDLKFDISIYTLCIAVCCA